MNSWASKVISVGTSIRHPSLVMMCMPLIMFTQLVLVRLDSVCVSQVRLSRIMKQSEKLQRESEATVARRETLVLRREALLFGSQKKVTKGGPNLKLQGLKRKIKNTNTVEDFDNPNLHMCLRHVAQSYMQYVCLQHVVEWEQKIRELQESKVSLSDRLAQQKQHLIELCGTSCNLDPDIENLQDTKHRVRSKYIQCTAWQHGKCQFIPLFCKNTCIAI